MKRGRRFTSTLKLRAMVQKVRKMALSLWLQNSCTSRSTNLAFVQAIDKTEFSVVSFSHSKSEIIELTDVNSNSLVLLLQYVVHGWEEGKYMCDAKFRRCGSYVNNNQELYLTMPRPRKLQTVVLKDFFLCIFFRA